MLYRDLILLAVWCTLAAAAPFHPSVSKRQWGGWHRPTVAASSPPPPPPAPTSPPAALPPPADAPNSPAIPPVDPVAPPATSQPPSPADQPPPASAPPLPPGGGAGGGEAHQVQLVNNCGSGEAVFLYEGDRSKTGSRSVTGPLHSGAAWLQGFTGANCMDSGVNCGLVEFTLLNGGISSADYSLLDGPNLGNHKFTYPMHFAYTGGCSEDPGPCTGASADQCPHAYWGSDTGGGIPIQCQGVNPGITITFC